MSYQLRGYQIRGVEFIVNHFRSMLHVWMALGKSAMVLHAIKYLFHYGRVYGVLVVGPKQVIDNVWVQEAHSSNWPDLNDITFSKITGTPKKRLAALTSPAHVHLINYENLIWLVPWLKHFYIDRGKRLPFNMIVFDEIRKMANADTKRYKALAKELIQYFNYRTGLTGTPSTRGLIDLHGQYQIIDDGASLGSSINAYRKTYFRASDWDQYRHEILPGMDKVIYQKISPITFSLNGDDYLELPEVQTFDIYQNLPEKLEKMYNQFERELLVDLTNGGVLTAPNTAAAKTKCRQIANGAVYHIPENHDSWENLHDIKLDIAEEIVSEASGNPMIIVYPFNSDRARLYERLKKYGFVCAGSRISRKENQRIIAAWNHGDLPGIITHSASFGHGLNLQFGGHRQLWYGLTWSLDDYLQMIHRLRRPHQSNYRIIVQRILMQDTVDIAMKLRLESNDNSQQALWAAMKKYMEQKYGISIMRRAS